MTNIGWTERQHGKNLSAFSAVLLLMLCGAISTAPAGAQATTAAPNAADAAPPAQQAPAPDAGNGSAAPTAPVPPPAAAETGTAITQGASGPPGSKVMTLDQIVALAINNNTNVVIARQRLQKAQEQIVQVDAQSRPQVNASLTDTYSSVNSFSTSGVAVTTPSLPGGGQIPVVTDQGGGSTGSFSGGGGGGTVNSTTPLSNLTSPATGVGLTAPASGTSSGTNNAPSGATGAGGSGAGASPRALIAGLPSIAQEFAKATGSGGQAAQTGAISAKAKQPAAQPHATDENGNPITTASRGQRNNYSGRLTVTQYIDLFGLISAAKDVEKITRDFYELDLNRVQNETALSTKDYFFNVLRDQEVVNVDQEQVNYATENVRVAQARYTAGTAAQYDVLTTQVTLANDQQALQAARNQLDIDRANLNNLIGIDPNTEITLKAPPLPPLDQPIDLTKSTALAFKQRPELRQADNNIAIARKLIKLAGAPMQPSLGIGAGASYTGPGSSNSTQSTFNLSAQLNFPLYDGGTTRSRVRQADIDLQTQLTTQGQLQQNVTLEVRQAYLNVSNAQKQAATAGIGVTQAQEAVRLAQVRYQNGIGTLLDNINAQAQLATARNNLATAQYNYQISLAQLVRAEGGR